PAPPAPPSFPTRRSSDLAPLPAGPVLPAAGAPACATSCVLFPAQRHAPAAVRISTPARARTSFLFMSTSELGRKAATVVRGALLDRKSTRLNSSHSQISY